jgi:hypothetical protein
MADKEKGDRIWLVLCTAAGVAVDVTLNKYSSTLPGYVVAAIWVVPAVLFVIWFWRVEKTRDWVKSRFLEHPVSYILMFLILIPFGWQATATMVSKLQPSTPKMQATIIEPHEGASNPPSAPQNPTQKTATPPASPQARKSHETKPPAIPSPPIATLTNAPAPAPTPSQSLVAPTTYGEQSCVGSACAQGPGSQATLNQYGAPKLSMTDDQRDTIRDAMKPFAGMVVNIMCNNVTEDSMEYANQLSKALNDAGLKAGPPTSGILFSAPGQAIPSGVMFTLGDDAIPAATALAQTMARSGLVSKPIHAGHATQKTQFEITISPNR